jgi:hypothetical protein
MFVAQKNRTILHLPRPGLCAVADGLQDGCARWSRKESVATAQIAKKVCLDAHNYNNHTALIVTALSIFRRRAVVNKSVDG